ncbi:ABC transporter substrate-binding protein [Clostridium beijerinckii]|uniref:ABC transporter substrate-binding protein n=1 Tax=Clostridium beijerinckii TaxID=1520 RepID=UPI0013615CFA|nr:ABC transporter substrate-binding protein [Clostridium beijerinckii]MZK50883.1 transporter substrate-binding domain-containing protein [Clostridium beijerinckii]MZK59085.1 transporter substrate-binding domain-containing protein [Clostridium beijerinckii]MZK69204.1 transporter substrate-binding domain-containing protein [Clostridium beijerinckii]MZK74576.1 transporter substrate-binding domain-containing protein [Clostridium beijerinckii]MZK86533.1 transporter substrate-binding domain-contain
MKKILKKLLIFIAIVNFIGIMFECTALKDNSKTALANVSIEKDRLQRIKEKGVINVAAITSSRTYFYRDTNTNEVSGIEADILSEIIKRLGVNAKIEINEATFLNFLEKLTTDDTIDVASGGIFITPEREKLVAFTQPLYKISEAIVVPALSTINFKSDLKNSVVGVVKGTVYEKLAERWKNENLIKDIATFDTLPELFNAVSSIKVDAGILDSVVGKYSLFKNSKLPLRLLRDYTPELTNNVGIAMRKNDITLLNAFNEKINEMKADGTMYAIFVDNGLDKTNMA